MNALPLKNVAPLREGLDDLIADHGLRRVALTLLARLLKRTRPPDTKVGPRPRKAPGLDLLNDHLRADMGLPPADPHRAKVDLWVLWGRHY